MYFNMKASAISFSEDHVNLSLSKGQCQGQILIMTFQSVYLSRDSLYLILTNKGSQLRPYECSVLDKYPVPPAWTSK